MDSEQQDDLRRIALQEKLLRFKAFDKAAAWKLGLRLKTLCEEAAVSTTIEIRLARETVFFYAMPETASSHADWARRKRNVVELMGQSSYRVGLSFEDGNSLEASMGLSPADYACHGGSFPLQVEGFGFIGVVTVSGLPQRQDHALVVRALAEMCGVELSDIALTS
ncbi:heme-degrading domain-containing protein [Pseudomonas capsici]|uniref:heme-degrading domain-containing protein n=1 Tax=Pseudomonas capsici TaxID=2810614 RepID=UPI000E3D6EDD|nr:heme-degrading domain-containing protein [Pseudomonas capsici]MCV4271304.1 heme-degrading domain-containing protein [Pseudomonas capsici]